ncbi:N-6 DNA methylase [Myroides odoratus]|uniref:site-specific DNA-methyltransferase (adenine-specific) n=1 Tax=Myroides odoratus TaxID=256 RepID=A0A378RIW8_MYROD|nr:N-6 DNA methylase [Myroides odoratus]QQU02187.1 N-6 DNA methylase [Myroides odoratus]STZ26905.1 Type I restriction-modification system methyltransferase subunit [Myroides odoratus]
MTENINNDNINIIKNLFNKLKHTLLTSNQYHLVLYLLTLDNKDFISLSSLRDCSDIKKELINQLAKSDLDVNVSTSMTKSLERLVNDLDDQNLIPLIEILNETQFKIESNSFGEVFDSILYRLIETQGRSTGDFVQPAEVTKFMLEIVDAGSSKKIFNPFSGVASFGISYNDHYFGQELNENAWCLGVLRLIAYNKNYSNYFLEDSIYNWPKDDQKFDLIISNPPLSARLDSKYNLPFYTLEHFLIEKSLQNLTQEGKLITTIAPGFLSRGSHRKTIEHLINLDLIDTIISFPSGLLLHTSIPFYAIIISKTKTYKNQIRIINSSTFVTKQNVRTILKTEELLETLSSNKQDSQIVRYISNQEVIDNNYNLQIGRYFIDNDIENPIKLDQLLTNVDLRRDRNFEKYYKITTRDLSDDIVSLDIDIDKLEVASNSDDFRVNNILNQDALIISSINGIRFGFFNYNGTPLGLPRDFYAVTFDTNKLNRNYLISQLLSESVKNQYHNLTLGTVLNRISRDDFFNITISLPSLQSQQSIYLEKISEYISETKGLSDLIKQHQISTTQDENSLLKHEIAGALKNARESLKFVMHIIEDKIKIINPSILELTANERLKRTFLEYLQNTQNDLDRINLSVNKMGKKMDFGQVVKKEIDLLIFLSNYIESIKVSANEKFVILKEFNYITLKENDVKNIIFDGDENLISNMLDNIINNAENHAFDSNQYADHKIKINLSYNFEQSNIQIIFFNTGHPLSQNLSHNQLIRKGDSFGKNKGTGIGLWYINEVLQIHNASFNIINETESEEFDGEFVTSIRITLPVNYTFYDI